MSRIYKEKQIVEKMILIYCQKKHNKNLCTECSQLLEYAISKLNKCKFGEHKGSCKNCKIHCYNPQMRKKIKSVMKFSGPRMIIYYPIYVLKHLILK